MEADYCFESQIAAPHPAVKSCHHPGSGAQTSPANLHGITYKAKDVTVTLCIVITIRVGGKEKKTSYKIFCFQYLLLEE